MKQKTTSKGTRKKIIDNHIWIFSSIVMLLLIADQATKYFISISYPLGSSLEIIKGILNITPVMNTGVSFGLFKGNNLLFSVVAGLSLIFFIYVYVRKKKYLVQYSMICAGISGNLIDRIVRGSVLDFVDISIWPIFNAADMFISVGMIWLIIILSKNKEDVI